MTSTFYKSFAFVATFFYILVAAAQEIPPALQQRLATKTRLADIMQEVDQYYNYGRTPLLNKQQTAVGDEEFENAYIHWKRFKYFHASRLDSNGNIRHDITQKIWDGMNELQKSKGSVKNKPGH